MFATKKPISSPSKAPCGCGSCASCGTAARSRRDDSPPSTVKQASSSGGVRDDRATTSPFGFAYSTPSRATSEPAIAGQRSHVGVHPEPQRTAHALRQGADGPTMSLGPRADGLDDAPYLGPDDARATPLSGTGMGCVSGPLNITTSGALQGGWTVNDYLSGGLSWGAVSAPGTAGSDGRGFKVQLHATYSNDSSLGVSQNFTARGANQALLDGMASYLGLAPGSVTNGTTINEPVLNASDPYASTGWTLRYGARSGTGNAALVSFADVPRMLPGCKGNVDFRTCFYSRGGPCQENSVCRTWTWTIDFTGTSTVNTVT